MAFAEQREVGDRKCDAHLLGICFLPFLQQMCNKGIIISLPEPSEPVHRGAFCSCDLAEVFSALVPFHRWRNWKVKDCALGVSQSQS